MNKCLQCGIETNNPKFCSRSCGAKYNNRKNPKRKTNRTIICPICGNKKGYNRNTCQTCFTKARWEKALKTPIKNYFRTKSPSRSKYNDIRKWARKVMELSGRERKCEICGFDVYVEVCHKKPVSEFNENSLIEEVNSLDNLIYLCPNHHIMLDKGLLYGGFNSHIEHLTGIKFMVKYGGI